MPGKWRARSCAASKAEVPRFNSGAVSKDTTHISVLDKDGNCFSMTHSLGMPSGVVTPGLGFMYNGCMGVFDPRPGRAGSIAPGKARFSSVVPSIVFKDGKPHLIIGAPGATQIAMGVLHVILNALDFDMTMVEAVSAPRFSATSDTIDISNRIQWKVERELQALGYPVARSPYTFGFAAVHAIRIHEDGLDGGADPGPRRRGDRGLDWHRPLLMGAADPGDLGIVAGDDPHALVEAGGDPVGRRAFQEGELVLPAGSEHAGAGRFHLRRVGAALQGRVAQRQAEIARARARQNPIQAPPRFPRSWRRRAGFRSLHRAAARLPD